MVAKKNKKVTSELESKMTSAKDMIDEDFFEPNQILKDDDGKTKLICQAKLLNDFLIF